MQATLLIDCTGPDPADPQRTRVVPQGTTIDHPDAWLLCLPERIPVIVGQKFTGRFVDGPLRAVPADAEATERLRKHRPDLVQS